MSLDAAATDLMRAAARITEASPNEENLRHELENALQVACTTLGVPWTPYELDRTLIGEAGVRFVDVIHGGVVIEYEPPKSFGAREGAHFRHACDQAEEYTELAAIEEGRPITEYEMVVWDGQSISFGRYRTDGEAHWDALVRFDSGASRLLLQKMQQSATPLVSPSILKSLIGLDSAVGHQLIPLLFQVIQSAERQDKPSGRTRKTYLLFREWRRIFGQAVGINTSRLEALIERQSRAHEVNYRENIPAYLFSLHTYLALVAKLVAALALPAASQNISDRSTDLRQRIDSLENGQLFLDAGVVNMLLETSFPGRPRKKRGRVWSTRLRLCSTVSTSSHSI